MQMMYVMHHAFRRDLDHAGRGRAGTPVTDRVAWRLLAAALGGLRRGAARAPHRRGRRPLAAAARARHRRRTGATLEAMEAEHARDRPAARGLRRRASAGSPQHADEDARAALAVRLVATRESLRRHLAHEETDAIAILQRLLTPGGLGADRRGALQGGPDAPARSSGSCRGRRTASRARSSTASSPRPGSGFKLIWLAHPRPVRPPGGPGLPARRLTASEPVALPHPREPRRGERDLPLLAQPDGVVRVPGGEVLLAGGVRGHRQEAVDRPDHRARARRTAGSPRTAPAARTPWPRARGTSVYIAASAAMLSAIGENHQSRRQVEVLGSSQLLRASSTRPTRPSIGGHRRVDRHHLHALDLVDDRQQVLGVAAPEQVHQEGADERRRRSAARRCARAMATMWAVSSCDARRTRRASRATGSRARRGTAGRTAAGARSPAPGPRRPGRTARRRGRTREAALACRASAVASADVVAELAGELGGLAGQLGSAGPRRPGSTRPAARRAARRRSSASSPSRRAIATRLARTAPRAPGRRSRSRSRWPAPIITRQRWSLSPAGSRSRARAERSRPRARRPRRRSRSATARWC